MSEHDENDIAIVGLALRVPGASTPEEYWENLVGSVECLKTYSDEDLLARGVSPSALTDPNYVRAGMPLQNVDQFDPEFFGFSPKEAAILDPQHRQFYEVAWEALERAGHPPSKFNGSIGVFAGCGMAAYFAYNILTNRDLVESVGLFLLRHTGNDKDFLATRVSYSFDLKGPSVNVQTACSTSLVAAHLAVQSLLSRECDMALAGGVTIELPHAVGYHYKDGEILSPDGHCRTFDHRSKGTIFGSGAGVVVLRRLADALADGDHIHAIIKGSAVNNDGSGKVGYLAPSVDGQAAAISEAIALSGVDADSIGYIECHGTATPVGDPIEIAALTQAFRESTERESFCYVGSVKTNIGHLDTAAGVASLIKASLALEHGRIPPSLNFEAPNPTIGFEGSPFKVADRLVEWNSVGEPRRAAVNSLGVGGTNAFVVLQEPPRRAAKAEPQSAQPLVLSARNRRALDDASQRLAQWLRHNDDVPLADIAWTLMQGRHEFEQRRVLAATSHLEAAQLLENGDARRVFNHPLELDRPSVAFMYPGGGAQYFQMGRGLYERETVFREQMDRGFRQLRELHKVDLQPVFLAETASRDATIEQLNRPSVQLPLIFLLGHALTKLWEHYGVTPSAVVGHSMGENTAACVAGVFSFEDALGLVLLRGQLMDEVPEGAMLSVSMPAKELAPLLGAELDLATSNSPQLSVASGPAALIDELAARLTRDGIDSQRVRIHIAAHSRMLDGILGRFRDYLRSIKLNEPKLPIASNRTGDWLPPARAQDPDYWVEHLRNTVLFASNVEKLLEADDRVFLEVGPGNILGSFVRQNPRAPAQRVFASLRHSEETAGDDVFFRAVIARLWAVGVPIKADAVWNEARQRVPLPTYAFQHQAYWIAPGTAAAQASPADARPMRLTELDDWFRTPRWVQQGILESSEEPATWLVFQTREPVADRLVQRLRERGHTVVTVLSGDTFTRLGHTSFTVAPEAGGVGYDELIDALAEANLLPDHVIHTWLLTWDRNFRPGSTFLHRNQEYGFYSLFHLAQALGKSGVLEKPIQFTVASSGALRVADEPAPYPDKATALGPIAVIPREYTNIQCRFVDVSLPLVDLKRRKAAPMPDPSSVLEALWAEISAVPGCGVFAWREGVRWQRHHAKWSQAQRKAPAKQRLRLQGVYMITGGLGGIAGVLAEWLAREYRAKLVLLARTPLPLREDWSDWIKQNGADDSISRSIERIRQLEALGAKVLAIAADVTVAERMQEVVAEVRASFGVINGVFHAAGVIRDNLIQLKSQRDIEEVFSAKVWGTLVLDELFAKAALDFMLLFSSTSSFVAPQGQVDYVGANAFLNAFADARRGERPFPIVALNWGVWKGVGMVGAGVAGDTQSLEIEHGNATVHEPRHPLLSRHVSARDGVDTMHWFEGTLSAEDDWIVDEHRLANGEALLPGAGYLEIIRASLAELGAGTNWQVSNLLFQNPLFVPAGAPRSFRLRLKGDKRRWDVALYARADAAASGQNQWQLCASARVGSSTGVPPALLPFEAIEARCTERQLVAGGSSVLRSRQEDHLRFGPRWRVLKRIAFGGREALAHLQLAAEFAHDLEHFGLHPGLLDIATGCAMDLIPGYSEQEVATNLWAPLMYRGFRLYGALTSEIVSWLRLSTSSAPHNGVVAFDIVIADKAGRVLVEVDQLTLRRIDGVLSAPTSGISRATTAEGAPAIEKTRSLSPGELALQHNVSQGIDAQSGVRTLTAALAAASLPSTLIVSSMQLSALIRQAESISRAAAAPIDTRFSRPQLDSDFEAPRDELETQLAELWGKLLGVEGVGIRDSFFDLGGHSLIAVRLFNEISNKFNVDLPMSVLMQSPTIAALCDLLRAESPELAGASSSAASASSTSKRPKGSAPKYQYLVPMHSGQVGDRTPLFIVAGMFGNVLNLSHLAHLLGEERPFYALQARGLYGDLEPHETFEEMARDYIAEIQMVQPQGPFLLGGFSGGGIVAYEIARQLLEQNQQIDNVILLDTPLPAVAHFSVADKASMLWQGFQRSGLNFMLEKMRNRVDWERQQYLRRRENQHIENGGRAQFQSRRIGDAFMRAVLHYRIQPVPANVSLFRPRLDVRFRLSAGRLVDAERNLLYPDNGWTPFVQGLSVTEVPGDHDSMVLEPNVRVLAAGLRRRIEASQIKHGAIDS